MWGVDSRNHLLLSRCIRTQVNHQPQGEFRVRTSVRGDSTRRTRVQRPARSPAAVVRTGQRLLGRTPAQPVPSPRVAARGTRGGKDALAQVLRAPARPDHDDKVPAVDGGDGRRADGDGTAAVGGLRLGIGGNDGGSVGAEEAPRVGTRQGGHRVRRHGRDVGQVVDGVTERAEGTVAGTFETRVTGTTEGDRQTIEPLYRAVFFFSSSFY
jgi:hypothetical protein